jgi:hypothetical protein
LGAELAQAVLPEGKKVMWFDTAVGYQALFNHANTIDLTKFDRYKYLGLSQLDLVAELYESGDPEITQYGVFVFDEHSSMYKINLFRVMEARHGSDPDEDRDAATQPDYGIAQNQLYKSTINFLNRVDTHVIFISHMRDSPDEKKRLITRPDYAPGFQASLKEQLTVLGYVNSTVQGDTYKRTVQVHPSIKLNAKTRISGFPVEASPDFLVKRTVEWIAAGGQLMTTTDNVLVSDGAHLNDDGYADTTLGDENV